MPELKPHDDVFIEKTEIENFMKRWELTQKEFTYLFGMARNVWTRKVDGHPVIREPKGFVLSIKRMLVLEQQNPNYLREQVQWAKCKVNELGTKYS